MTLSSDATPTSGFPIAALWGSFMDIDRTKWNWEAPASKDIKAPWLPKWLADLGNTLEVEEPIANPTTAKSKRRVKDGLSFRQHIRSFRREMKVCDPSTRPNSYARFNEELKKTLILGTETEEVLSQILRNVPLDIRRAVLDPNEASQYCLALCNAIWEGISVCKVLKPSDLPGTLMRQLLVLLSELPISPAVEELTRSIVASVTATQLQEMRSGLNSLVSSWVKSWNQESTTGLGTHYLETADQVVTEAAQGVTHIHSLSTALRTTLPPDRDFEVIQEAMQRTRSAIDVGAEAIQKAQDSITPNGQSIINLAGVLQHVPPTLLGGIVLAVRTVTSTINGRKEVLDNFWLALSQVQNVDTNLFCLVLKNVMGKAGVSNEPIRQRLLSNVLLNHWISQGLIARPALTRTMVDVSVSPSKGLDHGTLLHTMDEERQHCWDKTKSLLRMFNKLGQHEATFLTLLSMRELGMRIPSDVVEASLEAMASVNPVLAYQTYRLYRHMRYNEKCLNLDRCPTFITSMIDNPSISPPAIWHALGIVQHAAHRRHNSSKHAFANPRSTRCLSPATTEHISRMATSFAHSKVRSQRVSFLNVEQCLHYLRRHNAPISAEITRAIAHAGITRRIGSQGWIAKERARWILALIEDVEGTDVARAVEKVVITWNGQISERDSRAHREGNVLRVGLIN